MLGIVNSFASRHLSWNRPMSDDWLSRCADDTSIPTYASQRGEDRILQKLFERIGIKHQWCVEFGATDGKRRSNTWYWIHERGWRSVQIEGARDWHLNLRTLDRDSFDALQERYHDNDRVICLNRWVESSGDGRLDALLASTPIPSDFDLLSLDVDGAEYDIWRSLERYTPRVILVEHNKTIPVELSFHSDRGSSLAALAALGHEKGYELVAANDLNGVFVQRDLFPLLEIRDNTPSRLWHNHEQFRIALHDTGADRLAVEGTNKLRWVRGADGTLAGQLTSGAMLCVQPSQDSVPSVLPSRPRWYLSGLVRHWYYRLFGSS